MSDATSPADGAAEYERLESFLVKLTLDESFRERFAKDAVATMTDAGLSEETQKVILAKDEVAFRKLMGPQQFGITWLERFGLTKLSGKP